MSDFLAALGLAVVIEGVLYALFPAHMKRMIVSILEMPEGKMRLVGLAMAGIGVLIVWFVRG
ncbi:DUF2065 domain-containing protein [Varunaivibrio sulfuroxidans]|uniref:DUF2065 domain-containing protein n=1 Tax=Varunaivibrio sulfuroxidans TaxID=1773489 RepID=A0A4R3J584_9PROT|nr:DUF2065 domain-containing protein [Varunaivibrio sulfuroxidans]TCS60978.1 hypothetical protein EDD55_109140 [Varunaivibrio sulfuroxidans]WES31615.1 DUF2065 domain-containing protein [Varunaivibrio sulfuroxidans]